MVLWSTLSIGKMKLTKIHELNFEQLKNRMQSVVHKLDSVKLLTEFQFSLILCCSWWQEWLRRRNWQYSWHKCALILGHLNHRGVIAFWFHISFFVRFEVRNNWNNLDVITVDDELEALTYVSPGSTQDFYYHFLWASNGQQFKIGVTFKSFCTFKTVVFRESEQGELCRQAYLRFKEKGLDVDLRLIMVRYYSTQIFYHGFNFLDDTIAEGLDGPRWDAHSHQQSLVKKGDLIKHRNISPHSRLIVSSERVGQNPPGQGRVPCQSNGSRHHASLPVNDQIQLVQCHEGNTSHSRPCQPQSSQLKTNYERSVRIKAATHNVMVLSQASAAMKAKVPLTSELWEMNQ